MTFIQWFGAIWLTLIIVGAVGLALIYAWAATVERFEERFRKAERLRIAAKLRSDAYWFSAENITTFDEVSLAARLVEENVATVRDEWRKKRAAEAMKGEA